MILFGAESEFVSSGGVVNLDLDALSTSRFVVIYQDTLSSNYGKACIGDVDCTDITFGDAYLFNASGTSAKPQAIVKLTDEKFAVAYVDDGDNNYGKVVVGTVPSTGTNITFWTPSVFLGADEPSNIDIIALTETKIVVLYRDEADSNHGTAKVGTIAGTTITFGDETEFTTNDPREINACVIDDSTFVVTYRDFSDSSHGTALVGTVDGTTITFGSEYEFLSAGAAFYPYICSIDTPTSGFMVVYRDNADGGHGTAKIGEVSGTTITFGDESEFLSANGAVNTNTQRLASNKCVISYKDGADSSHGTSQLAFVDGTDIAFNSETEFLSAGAANYNKICILDDYHFVVVYADAADSNHGTAKVGCTKASITTSGDLFIYGYDCSSASGDLFVSGSTAATQISNSGDLYVHGYETASGVADLFIHGSTLVSGACDLFLCGYSIVSGQADLFVHGYSSTSISGDLYIAGNEVASGSADLVVYGYSSVSGSADLYIKSFLETSGSTDLYIYGYEGCSGNLDLFLHGYSSTSTSGDLYLHGYQSASGSTDLFIGSYNLTSGTTDLYINGFLETSGSADLYINGHLNSSGNIDLFINGHTLTSGECDLYIYGYYSSTDNVDLYIHGYSIASGQIDLSINGHLLVSGICDLYVSGYGLIDNSGTLYIQGVSGVSHVADCDLFCHGYDIASGQNDLYICGSLSSSGQCDLFVSGYALTTDQADLYIYGFACVSGDAPLLINGHIIVSGQNDLFIGSYQTTSGYTTLYLHGYQSSSGQNDLFIRGHDVLTNSGTLFINGLFANSAPLYINGTQPFIAINNNTTLYINGSGIESISGNITLFVNGLEEREPLACPILDPTAAIQIPSSLITVYQSHIDALINQLGKNVVLIFQPERSACPNCEYDAQRQRSTGVYKIGGPRPFQRGRKCPYCKGKGILETPSQKCIKCLIQWRPKELEQYGIAVQNRQGIVRLKTYLTNMDDIARAKTAIVDYANMDVAKLTVRRIRGPVPVGLRENRYCISFWELI